MIQYRHLPNYVLQVLVNKSVNMVYKACSCIIVKYIRKTSKSICLSYILARIMKLTMYLLIVLSAGALLIISHVQMFVL